MGSEQYRFSPRRDSALARARLALLGVWTGAMLAFGLLFVPAAFSNLPTQLAAEVLGGGFTELDRAGMLLGSACVVLGFAALRERGPFDASEVLRALLPLAGVLAHAISAVWVSPELHALRVSAGGAIGQLPSGDPGIPQFGQLHDLSRGLFALATGSAGLACIWDIFRFTLKAVPRASPDVGTS